MLNLEKKIKKPTTTTNEIAKFLPDRFPDHPIKFNTLIFIVWSGSTNPTEIFSVLSLVERTQLFNTKAKPTNTPYAFFQVQKSKNIVLGNELQYRAYH